MEIATGGKAVYGAAAGVDPATPVIGTEGGGEFTRVVLGNELELDVAAQALVLPAAEQLVNRFIHGLAETLTIRCEKKNLKRAVA